MYRRYASREASSWAFAYDVFHWLNRWIIASRTMESQCIFIETTSRRNTHARSSQQIQVFGALFRNCVRRIVNDRLISEVGTLLPFLPPLFVNWKKGISDSKILPNWMSRNDSMRWNVLVPKLLCGSLSSQCRWSNIRQHRWPRYLRWFDTSS